MVVTAQIDRTAMIPCREGALCTRQQKKICQLVSFFLRYSNPSHTSSSGFLSPCYYAVCWTWGQFVVPGLPWSQDSTSSIRFQTRMASGLLSLNTCQLNGVSDSRPFGDMLLPASTHFSNAHSLFLSLTMSIQCPSENLAPTGEQICRFLFAIHSKLSGRCLGRSFHRRVEDVLGFSL